MPQHLSVDGGLIGPKPMPNGVGRSLCSVGGIGLAEDTSNVVAHGVDTNEKIFANLPVGLAAAD